MTRLSSDDGEWFRTQHQRVLKENRELRKVIDKFCVDLEDSLAGKLIAQELRNRVSEVKAR